MSDLNIHLLSLKDQSEELLGKLQRLKTNRGIKSSTSGKWLAVWNRTGLLRVFDMVKKESQDPLSNNFKTLRDVQWSPDGNYLIAVGKLDQEDATAVLESIGRSPLFSISTKNYHFKFKTKVIAHKLDLRKQIAQWGNAGRDWSHEPFNEAFKSLEHLTQDIQNLRINDIKGFLKNQEREGTGQFEIAGLKVPVDILMQFGIWPLALIQLYFLLHFISFRKTPAEDPLYENLPWIGVYPDLWSRLVFVLSVGVLPVVSASLIAGKSYTLRPDAACEWGPAYGVSLMLAIFTLLQIQMFWKQLK
jgi:hypothetical protein